MTPRRAGYPSFLKFNSNFLAALDYSEIYTWMLHLYVPLKNSICCLIAFFAIGFMVSTFVGKKYLIVFSTLPSNSDIKNNYVFAIQQNRALFIVQCK